MNKRKPSPNQAKHDQTYVQKMKAMGYKSVRVWAPADRVDELQALAKQWREDSGKETVS